MAMVRRLVLYLVLIAAAFAPTVIAAHAMPSGTDAPHANAP